MLDIRLRLADDNGNAGRVIETLSLSWTGYSSQTVKFAVSEKISGQLDAPFLVLVEYTTSKSGPWRRVPRNDLFIVDEDSADSVDTSGAVTFTATGMLPWLAARYPLWWRPGDSADLERGYAGRTAGYILRDLIDSAKTMQGWGPNVTLGFTDPIDSAGQKWTEAVSQAWPLFTTSLGRVIQSLTEQGYMEWWSEGFQLKAVNPGTGADRSNTVTLGGPEFSRAPAARKFDPATAIVVQYELGWTHFDNPGAETRFGKLYKVMSQSGAKTRAAAEKNTQPALTEARAMQEELSYEWELSGDGVPVPWESFQVGDVVTARTRRGKKVLRVIGIDVSKDANGLVKATAVVGSKLLNLQAKLAKRSAAASVGQIIGGSGAALPPASAPAKSAPVPPTALRVAANTGTWGEDGTERSSVTIAWDAVSQAVDGFGVDVDTYEGWSRRASETMALLTRTAALSTTVTTWTPGEDRYVTVRARSRAGVWSEFAPEISVTPARPASIVPKAPTGLAVASNTGAFASDGAATATVRVMWAAVTASTADLPVTVGAYRAELEDGQAWIELAETAALEATFTVPSGKVRRVRVRARTGIGVWGDPSAPLSVTGANPAQTTTAASTPVLAAGMGLVTVAWDGKLAGGANPPASFQLLYAETAPAASGPWTRATGSPARGAGQVATIKGAAGSTVFVRLVWLDTLGRVATASAAASIAVTPIGGGDIDKAITDALDKAGRDATAAGQAAEKALQDALGARDAAKAAQDAADAAAARAAALLSSAENKIADPSMSLGQWAPTGGWAVATNKGRTDSTSLVATGTPGTRTTAVLRPPGASGGLYLPVEPGQVLEIGGWFQVDTAWDGTPSNSKLRPANQSGQLVGPNLGIPSNAVRDQWVRVSGRYTVPASGVTGIGLNVVSDHTNGLAWWDDFFLRDITAAVRAETDAKTAAEAAAAAKTAADAAAATAASALEKAGEAQTKATTALTSASGRNALFHDVTGPSGQGTRVGDIWQQWSSMAVNGRLLAAWRWSGSAWVKTLLDETYIPLLNIGAGTYGSLKGDRLVANSVSTKSLVVGDFTNLIEDEDFVAELGLTWARRSGATSASSFAVTTGLPGKAWKLDGVGTEVSVTTVNDTPVDPGAKYRLRLRAQVQLSGSTPKAYVRAYWFKTDNTASATPFTNVLTLDPAGWSDYSVEVAAPADAAYMRLVLIHGNNCTGGSWWVGRISMRPMNTGEMIVDGTLRGQHLAFRTLSGEHMQLGSLSVDLVEPAFGQNLDLTSNGSISLVTSIQAGLQQGLAQAKDDLAATDERAASAAAAASAARAGVSSAQQQVDAVRDAQAATQASLAQTQAYFRFANAEAIIGRTDSPTTLHLRNTGLEIREQGVPVMWATAQQIHVPSLVTGTVVLGNHQLAREGTGTVMRAL